MIKINKLIQKGFVLKIHLKLKKYIIKLKKCICKIIKKNFKIQEQSLK